MGGRRRAEPDAPRCTERVPGRLCGGLRGDSRPLCERVDHHSGKHRATKRLRGVGSTTWEWKGPDGSAEGVMSQPPVIDLTPKVKTYEPIEAVGKCGCTGQRHRCRRFRGLYRVV